MKNFLVGAAIVGVLVVGAAPVRAALSLTLSDGNPLDEQVLTDSASPGSILLLNGTVGNWSIGEILGTTFDNRTAPVLNLTYTVNGSAGNSSILTVTLTETGNKPDTSIGNMLLALGGVAGASTITQSGLINGSVVGSQKPLSGIAFDSAQIFTVSHLSGDEFSVSEQLVFTGTGRNGGSATLDFESVPEPGTALVGVFGGAYGFCIVARTFRLFRTRKR